MVEFNTSITISKKAREAWDFIINPANTRKWLGEVNKYEQKSGTIGAEGFRCRYYLGSAYIDQSIRLSEPYKNLVMVLENDDFNTQLRLSFSKLNNETTILINTDTEVDVPGAAFAESMVETEVKNRISGYISGLKSAIE